MNTLIKRLPLLGFVLAAVFAFAFTKAEIGTQAKYQLINGNWTDVSSLNYECDEQESEVCTYATPDTSTPLEMGRFILR